jgi:hypothetical protein
VVELTGTFGPQLVAIVLAAALSCGVALTALRIPSRPWGLHPAALCMAAGSGLCIAIGTLTRRASGVGRGKVQLELLATIREYLAAGTTGQLLVYVVGNVALFVPLGFFGHLALRRGVLLTGLLATGFSVMVEILQLPIWTRSTDIDDVLLNGIGGFTGALVAAGLVWLLRSPSAGAA